MWKDIQGYEGLYQISDKGEIRRFLKNGSVKPVKPRKGTYNTISLSKKGKPKSFTIHRLVATAFCERPEGTNEVNHIDGDKHNNNANNLEWVTKRGNLLHAMNILGHYPYGKMARRVRAIDPKTKEIVGEFPSVSEAARVIGTTYARASITQVCQGNQETAYGYMWEYTN